MKKLKYFLSSAFLLAMALSVKAQIIGGVAVKTAYTKTDLQNTIIRIRDWAAGMIGILAVFILLYAAFLFIAGGEEKREPAKEYLKYGIIGIVIAILSYSVVGFVSSFI